MWQCYTPRQKPKTRVHIQREEIVTCFALPTILTQNGELMGLTTAPVLTRAKSKLGQGGQIVHGLPGIEYH